MTRDYYAEPRPEIQALIDARGRSVLDVGCGAGELGAALKTAGAAYVAGVEFVPEAAGRARERLDALVEGDILRVDLSFAGRTFDYIVFADVLEHVPDPDAVIDRVVPLLAADGALVVSVPNWRFYSILLRLMFDRWEYTDHGVRDRTHLRVFTRRTLVQMLERKGFAIERLERNYRLLDDQSQIGRFGAVMTRVTQKVIGPLLFRNLLAYQYIAVARRPR